MTEAEHGTIEVLVVVAMPSVQTRTSEEAWEQDVLKAVSAAVYADTTLDTKDVRLQEYEDCQWVFERGMPMPQYGVTLFRDGSWHSGIELLATTPRSRGQDWQSLVDYLVEKGMVKKQRYVVYPTFESIMTRYSCGS